AKLLQTAGNYPAQRAFVARPDRAAVVRSHLLDGRAVALLAARHSGRVSHRPRVPPLHRTNLRKIAEDFARQSRLSVGRPDAGRDFPRFLAIWNTRARREGGIVMLRRVVTCSLTSSLLAGVATAPAVAQSSWYSEKTEGFVPPAEYAPSGAQSLPGGLLRAMQ